MPQKDYKFGDFAKNFQLKGFSILNLGTTPQETLEIAKLELSELGLQGSRSYKLSLSNKDSAPYLPVHTEDIFLPHPVMALMLACEKPADSGGETLLISNRKAMSIILTEKPFLADVRIVYKNIKNLEEKAEHLLIHESRGLFFRERVGHQYISYISKEAKEIFDEDEFYEYMSDVLCRSLEISYSWSIGDLLAVDNYRFLHGRNSYIGQRIMHRVTLNRTT